jgi:hypothetical protein
MALPTNVWRNLPLYKDIVIFRLDMYTKEVESMLLLDQDCLVSEKKLCIFIVIRITYFCTRKGGDIDPCRIDKRRMINGHSLVPTPSCAEFAPPPAPFRRMIEASAMQYFGDGAPNDGSLKAIVYDRGCDASNTTRYHGKVSYRMVPGCPKASTSLLEI